MKRLGISILLLCFLISGCTKESVEMDVISSHSTTADNWYELNINVIVDKDTTLNRETCSREIIQRILDNDFHSTFFSFELSGYPNKVAVDVFTSEKIYKKERKPILLNTSLNSIRKILICNIISKTILMNTKYNIKNRHIPSSMDISLFHPIYRIKLVYFPCFFDIFTLYW